MMPIYRFRPKPAQTLATILLLPLLVQLGLWQWHRAESKRALQQRVEVMAKVPLLDVGPKLVEPDRLRGRRVRLRGRYEAAHQILLDNQVHGEQVGYRVLTPLRIAGGDVRVLVDRGWIASGATRADLPQATPPLGELEVAGSVWEPKAPPFLVPGPASATDTVWQSADLARFQALAPYQVERFVVRLDDGEPGCYACDSPRPDDKVPMHVGYALQWFGMAAMLLVFYLYASFERKGNDSDEN